MLVWSLPRNKYKPLASEADTSLTVLPRLDSLLFVLRIDSYEEQRAAENTKFDFYVTENILQVCCEVKMAKDSRDSYSCFSSKIVPLRDIKTCMGSKVFFNSATRRRWEIHLTPASCYSRRNSAAIHWMKGLVGSTESLYPNYPSSRSVSIIYRSIQALIFV
jgi:hypothetical protein